MTHGLGRRPSPPDSRDYKLAAYHADVWPDFARDCAFYGTGPMLDQGATPHCFPAGTMVKMADNTLRPIERVQVLDRVVTAEGNEGVVTAVMAREYSGDLVSLKLRGHTATRCTPDHHILTSDGYAPASALPIGTYVAVPRRVFAGARTALYFDEVVQENEYRCRGGVSRVVRSGGVETIVTAPPREIPLDARFGRLLGLYAAEGYADHDFGARWAFNANEEHTLVADTVELIRDVLGAEARLQFRPNNVICVVLGGKHWRLLFDRVVGKGAAGKHLQAVLDGPDEFLEALLLGWMDGDGYRRRGSALGATVSRALALQMHAIANDLGWRPTIRERKPHMNRYARTRRTAWEVGWSEARLAPQSKLTEAATWRRLVESASEPFVGYVFNLEVENDHSYVADGLGVHNCCGFAGAHWSNAEPVVNDWDEADAHALYWECKEIDGDDEDGSYIRTVAKALKARGRLGSYAFGSLLDGRRFLLQQGPVIFGVDWYEGMFYPDANGVVHPTGDKCGGHAIAGIGADPIYCTWQQSWGTDWGDRGLCRISWDDLERVFGEYGEAMAAVELPLDHQPEPDPWWVRVWRWLLQLLKS